MCTIPFETCLLFIFQTVSDLFNLKYTALNELDDNPTPSFKEQRLVLTFTLSKTMWKTIAVV